MRMNSGTKSWFLQRSYPIYTCRKGSMTSNSMRGLFVTFPLSGAITCDTTSISITVKPSRCCVAKCRSKLFLEGICQHANGTNQHRQKQQEEEKSSSISLSIFHFFWFKFHISRFLCNQSVKEGTDREYVFTNYDNLTQILWT